LKAVAGFAISPNAKTILFPVEATQLIGTLGGIGELAREAIAGKQPNTGRSGVPTIRAQEVPGQGA